MVFWWSSGVQNSERAVAWECFGVALWQFQIRKRLSHGKLLRRVLERLKKISHAADMGVFLLGRSRSAKLREHHICGWRALGNIEKRRISTTDVQLSAFPFKIWVIQHMEVRASRRGEINQKRLGRSSCPGNALRSD